MKIGLDIKPFNSIMRFRRQELKLTQVELGRQAGVSTEFVGRVETLKMPIAGEIEGTSRWAKISKMKRFRLIREKLNRISLTLELDFDYLFPEDYLEAIEQELLPWYNKPIIWIKEVDILSLSTSEHALLLPSSEELVIDDAKIGLLDDIRVLLSELPERDAKVISMRYGIESGEEMTLKEVGTRLGITFERVRQIEVRTLRALRHPTRSHKLRPYTRFST